MNPVANKAAFTTSQTSASVGTLKDGRLFVFGLSDLNDDPEAMVDVRVISSLDYLEIVQGDGPVVTVPVWGLMNSITGWAPGQRLAQKREAVASLN